MLTRYLTHWKSSLAGLLSFVVVVLTTLTGFLGANDVNTEGVLQAHTKYLAYANCAIALCRAIVGFMQQDVGKVEAYLPGKGIQTVPSHETPDSASAIPVVKS